MKVLLDLAEARASSGFAGIPQDSRFLFARLNQSEQMEVHGLLMSRFETWWKYVSDDIAGQSMFIGVLHDSVLKGSKRQRAKAKLRFFLWRNRMKRALGAQDAGEFPLHEVNKNLGDLIWRNFLAMSIEPGQRHALTNATYMACGLGLESIKSSVRRGFENGRIDTSGYDYVVFQDSQAVTPSKGTTKVIRYHDGLPVLASDTMRHSPAHVENHSLLLRRCAMDSYFVCNSTSAQNDLAVLAPQAVERSVVIPYFIPPTTPVDVDRNKLMDIACIRISSATIEKKAHERAVETWFTNADRDEMRLPKYIMTLSTIEPRKNILRLISAWQRLRDRDPDLRLLIVGRPGWNFEQTLAAMGPFAERGLILHLQDVAQDELKYLYSGARAFVFPSMGEGFGLPPVEAMQCSCPVVVSDIPAHRYMAGDAALFCDPYDVDDIADKVSAAVYGDLAQDLKLKGRKNAARYTVEAVLPQWEQFFEKHRAK